MFRSCIKWVFVVVINRYSLIVALPVAMASQRCSLDLRPTSPQTVSGHLEAILSAPRRLQEASKLIFSGSGHLQERSKSHSRGFLTPSASMLEFGPRFGPRFVREREAWDFKNQANPVYCGRLLRFAHFQLESFLDLVLCPFWAPFWKPFGPQDG